MSLIGGGGSLVLLRFAWTQAERSSPPSIQEVLDALKMELAEACWRGKEGEKPTPRCDRLVHGSLAVWGTKMDSRSCYRRWPLPIIIDTGIGKSFSNPSPEALILFAMVEGRSCLCIVLMFPDGQIAKSLK